MDNISKLYNIKSKKNKQRCLSQKENNYFKKIDYLNKKKINNNNNIEKNNSNLNKSVYDSNINISKKYEKILFNKKRNKNNNNNNNKNYLIYNNNINNNNNKINNNFNIIFNNNNNNNSHLNTSYSCKKIINDNYNNNKNKINNNITNKKYNIEKRNNNFYLKNLPKHFESSVITYRKKSPYNIRDLSNSPSNKLLNEKTRLSRIPWKIKKKGIDLDMNNDIIYYKYLQKIKRPIKINKANKKINFKIDNNNNNIHNNNNININYKNNHNNNNNNNNNNNISKINNNNNNNENDYFNNNSLNNNNNNISIHVNQINIINSYENNLNYFKDFYLPIYNGPIDISCIRTKEKNLNDCIKNIENKIKKFNYFYVQPKQNQFIINNKNGSNSITIEIYKLINNNNNFLYNNNNNNDLFYYKIENKKKDFFILKDFYSFLNDLLEND